jgi:dTDP-4-dehydrorhamnose 3,5-epimerase
VCAVHVDRPDAPNKENKVHRFVLSEKQPSILFIPKEYANGIKALEPNTRILFFSDTSLEKSKNDDYRIPYDYWGKNIWVVDNR